MGSPNPERVLIHAPYGRDGGVFAQVLEKAAITADVCPTIEALCAELSQGAGALVIADEGLRAANIEELGRILSLQERWSDLPIIVLTGTGEPTELSRYRSRLRRPLGNVSLLERPLRTETAISAVEAALRARRRQYELRDLLKSLVEANTELTATNRELAEFAYVASHDLQEPLRMINIYTQLILRNMGDNLNDETRTGASYVHKGVERMETLLRDLLRFARVIHGEGRDGEAASLGDALVDSLSILKTRIDETGATVKFNGLPTIVGDQAQFSQVFANLISNSLKYRSPGEKPVIAISADPNGAQWVVKVKDNGIGFEQKHAERVFGLFKRLHRDEYPGTGIGLAICKRIVERHGGRIWVESEPGRGSTFYFTVQGTANR